MMGQSFHWMDREHVLNTLYDLLESGGGLAIVYQKRRTPTAIQIAEDQAVSRAFAWLSTWVTDRLVRAPG